ncbi:hypothetical protein [Aquimarina litoralis]|uniref:hypothetical protein n=1 Tax=Aquimarina litoralis TaxID=584605 RepID=UPI001C5A02BA|nr:hypothetical protein [Aquimarina litoralis]MBW1298856.1 hypothetical protein [Aquimarina litoralis]
MKKKKLSGLSLKKNVVSRLGSSAIRGGNNSNMSMCDCPTGNQAGCPGDSRPFSKDCIVRTGECGPTEVECQSIQVACE